MLLSLPSSSRFTQPGGDGVTPPRDACFLAADWGTTNRRIHLIDADGHVARTEQDDQGAIAMQGRSYAQAVADVRARFGDLPMLIAGMAGSNRGWQETAYVDCPADIAALSGALLWVEPGRTAIVPGVCQRDRADVMRGEEVQFLGASIAGLVPADAVLCQPGTHCKWAQITDGCITRFSTSMTGECFAMLRQYSLLAPQMDARVVSGDAFADGVRDGAKRPLLEALFSTRAAMLLGQRAAQDSASYVSGVIIGHDVGAQLGRGVTAFHLLADGLLATLYASAADVLGMGVHIVDSQAAFACGIHAIWKSSHV